MKPYCLNIVTCLLIFLVAPAQSFAQQGFVLSGVIKEKESGNRIAEGQIMNQRTGLTVSSSSLGLFQISAALGDTLLVMKSGFSDFSAAVNSSKTDMIILMDRDRTLRQVDIVGQSKKSELNDIRREYRNKGSFHQGKPPFLSFLFTPLTAVYELFGRTPKNARRFGRYYETEMEQTLIDGLFNESLIQGNTELKGPELEKFMLDYRPEYEKAKSWTQYDAIKYIRDSNKKYTDTLTKK
ncbi:MAG TPA: hypothetical protein VKB19_13275 [Pedobacter sp.]|nr:hypothetical protein [Pedobacter sp.]